MSFGPAGDRQPPHRAKARQRLAPKAKGRHALQVLKGANLGRVVLARHVDAIPFLNPPSIVAHFHTLGAVVVQTGQRGRRKKEPAGQTRDGARRKRTASPNLNRGGSGVECVLNQLLDNGAQVENNLARLQERSGGGVRRGIRQSQRAAYMERANVGVWNAANGRTIFCGGGGF